MTNRFLGIKPRLFQNHCRISSASHMAYSFTHTISLASQVRLRLQHTNLKLVNALVQAEVKVQAQDGNADDRAAEAGDKAAGKQPVV